VPGSIDDADLRYSTALPLKGGVKVFLPAIRG